MKKTYKILLVIVIALLAAIAGLLGARDLLVKNLLESAASEFSLHVDTLQIQHIGFRSVAVERLRFTIEEDAQDVIADIEELHIEFDSWLNLPHSINTLSITDGFIQIDSKSAMATASGELSTMTSVEPWLGLLLSIGGQIERFEVVYSQDYKNLLFEMIGALRKLNNEWVLDARFGLLESFLGHVELQLGSTGNYRVRLSELDQERHLVQLNGHLKTVGEVIDLNGRGSLDLHAINRTLLQAGYLPTQWVTDDRTQVELQLQLPSAGAQMPHVVSGFVWLHSELNSADLMYGPLHLDATLRCDVQSAFMHHCTFAGAPSMRIENFRAESVAAYLDASEPGELFIRLLPEEDFALSIDLHNETHSVSGGLSLQVQLPTRGDQINVQFAEIMLNKNSNQISAQGRYAMSVTVQAVQGAMAAQKLELVSKGELRLLDEQLHVSADSDAVLKIGSLIVDGVASHKILLGLEQPLHWRGDWDGWHIAPLKLRIGTGVIQTNDLKLIPGDGSVRIEQLAMSNQKLDANAKFRWEKVQFHRDRLEASMHDIEGGVSLRSNQLHWAGETRFGKLREPVLFEGAMDTTSGTGSLRIDSTGISLAGNPSVNKMIATTGYPLQWSQGKLTFTIRSQRKSFDQPFITRIGLQIEDAAGEYAQAPFQGFALSASLEQGEVWKTLTPLHIRLNEMFIGVPLQNLQIDIKDLQWSPGVGVTARLSHAGLETLGGSILATETVYDSSHAENEIMLKLSDLSLEKLIELQHTEDLYASGYLNGELPVRFKQGQATIENGRIYADERGGVIRYQNIGEIIAGKANLSIVSDLLKNFHYVQLAADANLAPSGDLLLNTRLHGQNPDMEQSAVNLNFNIEFNLPKALKTARLLYNIDRDVEAYIRSKARH